MTVAVSQWLNH